MFSREKEKFLFQCIENVWSYLRERLQRRYKATEDPAQREYILASSEHVNRLLDDKVVAGSLDVNPFYPPQLKSAKVKDSLTKVIDTAHEVVHRFLPDHILDPVDKFFEFGNPIYDEMLAFVDGKNLQFNLSDLEFLVLGIASNPDLSQHALQHYKYLGMYMGVLLELLQKQAGFDPQQGDDVIDIDLYNGYFPYLFFGVRYLSGISSLVVRNAQGDYILGRIASPNGEAMIIGAYNIVGDHCMNSVALNLGNIDCVFGRYIYGNHTLSGAASYGGNIHAIGLQDCVGDQLLEHASDFGGKIERRIARNIYKADGTPYEHTENDPVVVENVKVLEKN